MTSRSIARSKRWTPPSNSRNSAAASSSLRSGPAAPITASPLIANFDLIQPRADSRKPIPMFERLEQLEKKYEELSSQLADPTTVNDSSKYQKIAKAHSDLS